MLIWIMGEKQIRYKGICAFNGRNGLANGYPFDFLMVTRTFMGDTGNKCK